MHTVQLKPGREKSALHRHPWLFSGGIAQVDGEPEAGATVRVVAHDGRFLGWAAYSPASQIRIRFWGFDEGEAIDRAFFRRRLQRALASRSQLALAGNAARIVHAESDGLPGLVVDRYGDVVVAQFLSAGPEAWREVIVDELMDLTGAAAVFERSDADVRELEGLAPRAGLIAGKLPEEVDIEEYGIRYRVDIEAGQKTGFYLDQRANRRRIGELATGADVLNCFCYTGGFSLAALRGGARSVVSVDSSAEALAAARVNAALNEVDGERAEWVEADVFQYLRKLRDMGRQFDLIVLDPPKFAPTAQHVERAARAYKDINLWALRLLKPGGLLATFTCSGGMSADLFQKILAGSAWDAHAEAQIVERFSADVDHPVSLNFPEGDYLKGLLLRKVA
ncbi:class I SAM-dependent rRNA methyltransferase [Chitinimonas koreensis]|uniref:class I SAM-dependent rRNA methyltransferase n=1 Tax=Chitinimonas koreensis TaxID=356302 RepID=UPI00040B3D70|nr:class I SAM-dependent rRNA methyltransferase [Chitinimonas koreensis]QNM97493.1 class I SAM-dependent rRNA methyltransferase [Chitinimonas koreensis]